MCSPQERNGEGAEQEAPSPDLREGFVVFIRADGTLFSPWWNPTLDQILEDMGVPESDPARSKWCG